MEVGFDFKGLTADTIKQYLSEIQTEVTVVIDTIVGQKGRTFHNTVQPLINIFSTTECRKHSFTYASNFYPQKEIRDAGTDAKNVIDKFFIDTVLRKDLY